MPIAGLRIIAEVAMEESISPGTKRRLRRVKDRTLKATGVRHPIPRKGCGERGNFVWDLKGRFFCVAWAILCAEETLNMNVLRRFAMFGVVFLSISFLCGAYLSVPCAAQQPPPSIPSTGFAGLDQYRASRIAVFTDDYGQLARYRNANAALNPTAAGEHRVVFFGDSITDIWKLEQYFPGKPYVNRGIGGQTTPQMLVRFRQDVIELSPSVVLILAGTNDIAGNTGPMRSEDIEANLASMAELARLHGIRVVFASILPVHNYTPKSQDFFAQRPGARILELNKWLSDYCAKNNITYLDYFSALVDEKGLLKRGLAEDGLHPNDAGYKVMAPLAEQAITKALGARGDRGK